MKSGNVFFRAMLALWMTLSAAAQAETIVLAVPGPGSLAFLPVYLAKAIEADHEQGLELKHLHRQTLDMECVAEGVEDARSADLLGSMGVEILQGYHFAKPMPIDDYLAWLAARTNQ